MDEERRKIVGFNVPFKYEMLFDNSMKIISAIRWFSVSNNVQ